MLSPPSPLYLLVSYASSSYTLTYYPPTHSTRRPAFQPQCVSSSSTLTRATTRKPSAPRPARTRSKPGTKSSKMDPLYRAPTPPSSLPCHRLGATSTCGLHPRLYRCVARPRHQALRTMYRVHFLPVNLRPLVHPLATQRAPRPRRLQD
jgi:hypothetical protein